jgi:hypothetical protein
MNSKLEEDLVLVSTEPNARGGQKAKAKVQEQHDGKFHKLHSQKQERK